MVFLGNPSCWDIIGEEEAFINHHLQWRWGRIHIPHIHAARFHYQWGHHTGGIFFFSLPSSSPSSFTEEGIHFFLLRLHTHTLYHTKQPTDLLFPFSHLF